MADTNEHLENLYAARRMAVAGRRELAGVLAERYSGGHTERMRELFIEIRSTIEAIDRAIEDEQEPESNGAQSAG